MEQLWIVLAVMGMASALFYAVGWRLGSKRLPEFMVAVRSENQRRWPSLSRDKYWLNAEVRQAAYSHLVRWTLIWPVLLVTDAVFRVLHRHVTSLDPVLQQERIDTQQKRIHELETELGMKRS